MWSFEEDIEVAFIFRRTTMTRSARVPSHRMKHRRGLSQSWQDWGRLIEAE